MRIYYSQHNIFIDTLSLNAVLLGLVHLCVCGMVCCAVVCCAVLWLVGEGETLTMACAIFNLYFRCWKDNEGEMCRPTNMCTSLVFGGEGVWRLDLVVTNTLLSEYVRLRTHLHHHYSASHVELLWGVYSTATGTYWPQSQIWASAYFILLESPSIKW